jgi:hypothetical protein
VRLPESADAREANAMPRLPGLWVVVAAGLAVSGCNVGSGPITMGQAGGTDNNNPFPDDTVSGTVMLNGAPLSGVTVTAFLTNTNAVVAAVTTDAQGHYALPAMKTSGDVTARYQIWAEKAGYGFAPAASNGAAAKRADFTGQFQGNGVTDIAIYFTVIEFNSVVGGSRTDADFVAYDGSHPLVEVPATGQQTSYTPGDDGDQQKGVAWGAARFADNGDGTVTDKLTGLVWLKQADCLMTGNWFNALVEVNGLASGLCGLTDRSTAGQWRMPNLNELESLIDGSASHPALPANSPFSGMTDQIEWTSTSYFHGQAASPAAWAIRMSDGRYINDGTANDKTSAQNAVWAVRGTAAGAAAPAATGLYPVYATGDDGSLQTGAHLTYPRFIDKGDGTVTDTMTGLVWLKQANCIRDTWANAAATVTTLASGACGLSDGSKAGDWRMPNRKELASLSDRMETNHADFFNARYVWKSNGQVYREPIFSNFVVSEYYWTSSTVAAAPSSVWTLYSCDFGVYDTDKGSMGYTLAVR